MSYGTVQAEKMTTESGYSLGAGNASSFKNRIINGGMVVDQRNAGASVTITNVLAATYLVDRWAAYGSVTSKFSAQRNAGAVTPPTGFINYLGATSLSSYTVGASELYYFYQPIEGLNLADLAWGSASAQSVTVSFWVRSSLTGTFSGAISNGNYNRSYPFSYTINSANTWEYKTVTIPGDTTGTWATDNTTGANLFFNLGTGPNNLGTANAWTAAGRVGATGSQSIIATNGATFYITGVQLEVGSTATSFDYRPYGTELALCQRYARTYGNGCSGIAPSSTTWWIGSSFESPMRATPTSSLLQTSIKISDQYTADPVSSGSTVATADLSSVGGRINISGYTGLVQGRLYTAFGNTNPFLLFSAEL